MSLNFTKGDWWVPFAEAAVGAWLPVLAPLIAAFELARQNGHSSINIASGTVGLTGTINYDPTLNQYIISGVNLSGAGLVTAVANAFQLAKQNGSAPLTFQAGSLTIDATVVYDATLDKYTFENVQATV